MQPSGLSWRRDGLMMIRLGEAVKITKISRSTLTRAIQAGKISAQRDAAGNFLVDPAELARVFSDAPGWSATARRGETSSQTDAPPILGLQLELAGARAVLQQLETRIADLREDRDSWKAQAERLALPAPAAIGFLARLFGRAA